MPSWLGVFQFSTFMSIALSESNCISAVENSSILVILFSCYLSIWPFCYALSVPIVYFKTVLFSLHEVIDLFLCILLCSFCSHSLLQNCFVFFAWGYWFVLMHLFIEFFSLFWKVLICLCCLSLSCYLSNFIIIIIIIIINQHLKVGSGSLSDVWDSPKRVKRAELFLAILTLGGSFKKYFVSKHSYSKEAR